MARLPNGSETVSASIIRDGATTQEAMKDTETWAVCHTLEIYWRKEKKERQGKEVMKERHNGRNGE
jgi:hypothetical protein